MLFGPDATLCVSVRGAFSPASSGARYGMMVWRSESEVVSEWVTGFEPVTFSFPS